MTLEGFLFFFCFFFFCFFRTLIYILRKPKVFWEKCTIFNVVRALICHYILLEKKKEVQLVIWKTHFESISQTLKTYESLMCSNFYIKLTLCVKELFFFFFFLKLWQNFWSGYKLKKYKSARAPPNDHQTKTGPFFFFFFFSFYKIHLFTPLANYIKHANLLMSLC